MTGQRIRCGSKWLSMQHGFFIWLVVSNICIFNFNYTGWWFGTCFIFPYIGNNNPNWRTHIFQRGRYTTNQFFYLGYIWDDDPQWLVFCPERGSTPQTRCIQVVQNISKWACPVAASETGFDHPWGIDPTWKMVVAWVVDWEIMGIWKYQWISWILPKLFHGYLGLSEDGYPQSMFASEWGKWWLLRGIQRIKGTIGHSILFSDKPIFISKCELFESPTNQFAVICQCSYYVVT